MNMETNQNKSEIILYQTENIQIDSGKVAHFIDWGNSSIAHSSLDYALLETSIWSSCLPFDYIMEDIYKKIRRSPYSESEFRLDETLDYNIPINRCFSITKYIRYLACDLLIEPKSFHYCIGLFFCCIQQLQYEDANLRALLILSDYSIKRLESEWGYTK
ncbi:MAG: hypothetical protein NTX22_06125 [Ignavibacteriales bacterium]|nr:hypothetical protein [Ignavibacteriales bacterium]